MKCEEIQNKILLNDAFIDEEKSHLESCPDCKAFNKDFGIIIAQGEELDVPTHLDDKVLNFAKQNRPKKSKSVIPFILFAAAALVAIGLMMNSLEKVKSNSNTTASTENIDKNIDLQEVVKTVDTFNESKSDKQDDIIESLWEDDQIDADLLALEGELFVLSAELYSE
ncbi:MAG: hypothetical protein NE334_07285 [Lentisphaeraceae bacterium]|nr:hypothetical protein [Lentisphaeraceae bacterium]